MKRNDDPTKKNQRGRISRRDFIRLGTLGVGGAMASTWGYSNLVFGNPLPADQVDREVFSSCVLCQTRCTTIVQIRNERVVNIYGHPENEWTGGAMCPKGKSMVELTYSPHRLLYPLLRRGDVWERISYPQALEITAEKISNVKKDYPEDYTHRVALFAPLWESRESELAAEMLMNLAGFPDASHAGDTCIGNAGTAMTVCLGTGISETTVDELPKAEVALLLGANIAELYPPYARWLQMARERGVELVYVDPRITPTSNFCGMILRNRPGTDGALVLGIIRHLIASRLYDRDFIDARVNGFDLIKKSSDPYDLSLIHI